MANGVGTLPGSRYSPERRGWMNAEKKAVLIHAKDNVAVVLEDVKKGEAIRYWYRRKPYLVVSQEFIAKGHKLAVRPIARNAVVKKYGISIGRATKRIERGQLVHIDTVVSFVR
jgi:hypothetical protein